MCSSPLQSQSKGHFLSIILKYQWSAFRIRNNSSRELEGGKAWGSWWGDDTHVAACEACTFHRFPFFSIPRAAAEHQYINFIHNWIKVIFSFPFALPWAYSWGPAVSGTDEPSWLPGPCSHRLIPREQRRVLVPPAQPWQLHPHPTHSLHLNHQQLLTSMQQLGALTPTVIYPPIHIFWYLEAEDFSEKGLSTKMTINLNVFTTEDWPEEFIKSLRDLMYIKWLHKVNTLERTRQ